MKDAEGKSKGFGFICFKEAADAQKALSENMSEPGTGCLYVKAALSKDQRQLEVEKNTLNFKKSMQFLSLYIKGFNPAATQIDDIKTYYSNFGEVKNLKYTMTGACLISFADREAARNAKETTHGTMVNGRILEVTYFEPREIREL